MSSGGGSPPDLGGYDQPAPPNYRKIAGDVVKGQTDVLPLQLKAEGQYGNQFNQLDLERLQRFAPQYAALMTQIQRDSAPGQADWQLEFQDKYGQKFAESDAAALKQQRELDIQMMESLGPRMKKAMDAADPTATAMRELLGGQITGELGMGANLDPSLAREVAQSVRRGQQARGMTAGNSPVAEEAMFTGLQANQLRRERQGQAFSYLGLPQFNAAMLMGDPNSTSAKLSGANSFATQAMGMVANRGPSLINKGDIMPAYGQASQNWANQSQMGWQNHQQAQDRAYMDWQQESADKDKKNRAIYGNMMTMFDPAGISQGGGGMGGMGGGGMGGMFGR